MTERKSQWTEEKAKELIQLLDDGRTTHEMVLALGATKNAIIGKLHRLGRRVNGRPYVSSYTKPVRRHRPRLVIYRTYAAYKPDYMPPEESVIYEQPMTEHPDGACDIMSLTRQTCHWPLWQDHTEPKKLYCGKPTEGKIYCAHHLFMVGPLYRRPAVNQLDPSPLSAPPENQNQSDCGQQETPPSGQPAPAGAGSQQDQAGPPHSGA
jgi:hypothetical protein